MSQRQRGEKRTQSIVHRGYSLQHREVRSRHPDDLLTPDGAMELMGPGIGPVTGISPDPGDVPPVDVPNCAWDDLGSAPFGYLLASPLSNSYGYPNGGLLGSSYTENGWVDELGTSAGITKWESGEQPSWSDCGISGTWAGAWHTGTMGEFTMTSALDPATDRVRVRASIGHPDEHSLGKRVGLFFSAHKPTALDDNILVGTAVVTGVVTAYAEYDFWVPASMFPAVGENFWLGLKPVDRANDDVYYCSFDNSANTGSEGGYKLWMQGPHTWLFEQQGMSDACFTSGAEFANWQVGYGDGSTSTYVGQPTVDGTAKWYVDGLLTKPLTLDEATGTVTFDRDVSKGAPVVQSGVVR